MKKNELRSARKETTMFLSDVEIEDKYEKKNTIIYKPDESSVI